MIDEAGGYVGMRFPKSLPVDCQGLHAIVPCRGLVAELVGHEIEIVEALGHVGGAFPHELAGK
jgi:hypothetical protein